MVASLGVDSGYVPYTAYCAKKSFLSEHPEAVQSFTNAIQKGLSYVNSHSAEEIASVISPQFPETDVETIAAICEPFIRIRTPGKKIRFLRRRALTCSRIFLEEAGALNMRVPYEDLVTTEFSEAAKDVL